MMSKSAWLMARQGCQTLRMLPITITAARKVRCAPLSLKTGHSTMHRAHITHRFFANETSEEDQGTASTRAWENKSDGEIRTTILEAALTHVQTSGFSVTALTKGAKDCGFESTAVHGMFDNGGMALLDHLCRTQTNSMVEAMQGMPLDDMTPLERVRCAIRTRLEMNAPYSDIWPSAMALGASSPDHLHTTHAHIAHTVECVWGVVGMGNDESTDVKKAALGGVYVSTELFMLSDQSVDHANTWAFLDRRLADLLDLQGLPLEIASKATVGLQVLGRALQSLSPEVASQQGMADIISKAKQAAAQAGQATANPGNSGNPGKSAN